MEEEKFKLNPAISPSEKAFREKIGAEKWESMKMNSLHNDGFKCGGCGFEPYEVAPEEVLNAHLEEEDEQNPDNSKLITLCSLCHVIEHADVALERGYVQLVNSLFSQGELINICRNGELAYHLEKGEIRILKKTHQEFLEELKDGRSKEGKVKFILTESYLNSIGIH